MGAWSRRPKRQLKAAGPSRKLASLIEAPRHARAAPIMSSDRRVAPFPCPFERQNMAMMFPNLSRSYDATRRAIRFWGYDRAMEWSFFVTEGALKRMSPEMVCDEPGMLHVFDANRELICTVAKKLYNVGSKGSYELNAADL